jgi:SAM-dependent methyltransferase
MIAVMSSYDVIAQFYDSVVADPNHKAAWLRELIRKYHPSSNNLLELACGTGSLLEILSKDYEVVGLDNSAGMLKVAHRRLPNTEFFQENMSSFRLKQKFDVVLCIYDSINHLLQFSEWQSMFKHTADHLNHGGLFIFDMNTVEFLESLNAAMPSISHFSDNTMTIGAEPSKDSITTLKVEVSEKRPDGTIRINMTDIPENSFDVAQVQAALEKHFMVLGKLGEQRFTEWTVTDNKVVFICQLK